MKNVPSRGPAPRMVLSLAACGGKERRRLLLGPAGASAAGSSSSSPTLDPAGAAPLSSASSSDGSHPTAAPETPSPCPPPPSPEPHHITLNRRGPPSQLKWTVDLCKHSPHFTSAMDPVVKVTARARSPLWLQARRPSSGNSQHHRRQRKASLATCNVTCDWKAETDPTPDTSKPNGGSSSGGKLSGSSSSGSSSSGRSSSGSKLFRGSSSDDSSSAPRHQRGFVRFLHHCHRQV